MRAHLKLQGASTLGKRQVGLTLIELMVSLALGLLIVVAMVMLFVGSSTARREVESSADVIENGRYAIDVLTRELSQTGFYGSLVVPTGSTAKSCSTDIDEWRGSLAIHVLGWNNADTGPGCFSRKAGTDAIFIQRASTCSVGDPGCEAEDANDAYLQVSECGSQYATVPFRVEAGAAGVTKFDLQNKECLATAAKLAPKRKLIRRFFYIDNDVLTYRDMTLAGIAGAAVPLVENIEQFQIEYAIDSTGDGSPDSFSSTPAVADWPNVIGTRVWVLARSSAPSRNASAAMTFQMGDLPNPTSPPADKLKRRVYSVYIPFVSAKMRREQ
jgi:type IV pilus assembly protein PilW